MHDARERSERATMAKPDDWIDQTVIIGTDMYGGDTMGTLEEVSDRGVVVRHEIVESEVVEIESEIESEVVEIESESEAQLQSIFYPWTKVNWMYHPEE
jgi:translation initiation factor 6 (eIF-6)